MAGKVLDPHLWNLENLFKSIYDVPVYQRPYSWDKEQVDVLLDDIIETYKSESKEEGYYTGNIIVFDKNDKINGLITKYDIIDGQQRITTFSLILLALYTLSLSIGVSESDKTLTSIKSALWKYVNREFKKELKAVSLNSIEKKCFSDIYNRCFDSPKNIISYCNSYHCESSFDERVISNFKNIYEKIRIKVSADDQNEILDFADYIFQYVQFIVIEANCKANKVFSMFESINSKGKKLEEIDLIKTYIFSQLDEAAYSTYLDKWGELIIKTKDNLYDYLYNYIKAYLCFYRQNISIINFKAISKNELLKYFNETSVAEAFKKMLDDMYDKVDDECLPMPAVDLTQIQTGSNKRTEANLPKMGKLIEFGIVKPGDKLYITLKPDESVATLLDEKYVDYQGSKLTINEWGCKMTGWQSIRIYAYVAIVGEIETLHQKRIAFIQEHNEPVS